MNVSLQVLFDEIEKQRMDIVALLGAQSPQTLNNSRNNKWSISEICGHLITSERLSLAYMIKKINAIHEVDDTGLWNEFKMIVFIISQRLPLKYKAPKSIGDKPPSFADARELISEWEKLRGELKQFLENFPENGLQRKIYRHPVLGRCNIVHGLKFFREHTIHHLPQIKRQL